MRRSLILPLLLLSAPLAARAADAEKGAMMPPPMVAAEGVGVVHAAPDLAVVRFGVQQQAPTAQKAQAAVNAVMEKVMASLRKLGVPANKIATDRINLYPVYAQPKPGEYDHDPKVIGFRATNTLRVELALDAKGPTVGSVLDAALAGGANSVDGVSFEIADDTPQRIEALRLASANARAKATAIASSLGAKLGALREAHEAGAEIGPPQPMMMKSMAMDMRGASTSVEPGEIQVRASVQVRYALE
ncbi:SIMPL domain-containing protein [Vulgatibacter incomptus]|uniref:Outer membrane protein n=1 Tax=Vulgatibacter incomptus TaxID=1391653 RepID=A0A0K1PA66_9BACT|nr:SIMPL domain-containing protein [Vulgatibacter incomptus]AKU90410.1 hypothetical protein AKJ08_0797 [Vulgatibacter incomptus]